MITKILLKIKKGDTPFWRKIRKLGLTIIRFNIPTFRPLHLFLFYLHNFLVQFMKLIYIKIWCVPLFKARCECVGKRLFLPNGIPLVVGHTRIIIGDNVTIYRTTIGSTKIGEDPILKIGNNVTIGYGTVISVGKKISMGNYVMIGPHCFIADNDGHPLNPQKRMKRSPVDVKDIKEVIIEDNVWIGNHCTITKGVRIGKNSVIGANSLVTKNIPENCIAIGVPARVLMKDIDHWYTYK